MHSSPEVTLLGLTIAYGIYRMLCWGHRLSGEANKK